MLVGTYEHKIDSKSRIVLPSKFREELGDSVVSTIGIDGCVSLYSCAGWEKIMTKLENLPFSKSRSRGLLRIMLSSAHELSVDSAGRILLPQILRQHGDLTQDVVFVGVNDHAELWDREKWNAYREEMIGDLSDIAEGVDGF
ncbi:MAG: division/cell wall cluster transcriptional repressor MraZ [Synergistaceae bacterium]|nr:division/cell wall cluster transcriptional repressor MraZ [Synergistaceae bacterium]